MFARALTALAVAISATTALAEETIRLQASAPGSTMFVVGTHLATVLKERHGYTVEVATGFPGVRSMVNTANYETELAIYAPAMSYFLQKGIAMYKDTPNHAELAAKLRPLFTYEGDLFTLGTYDPDIRTLADLEDKRVFLGPQGAALVTINSALIEAATGLKAGEDYDLVHVDWPGSPALLQDGTVDVLFQLCAVGCSTWAELSSARPDPFPRLFGRADRDRGLPEGARLPRAPDQDDHAGRFRSRSGQHRARAGDRRIHRKSSPTTR
jgi:TRAP-type uncharacterized transport system substrate-binding protein